MNAFDDSVERKVNSNWRGSGGIPPSTPKKRSVSVCFKSCCVSIVVLTADNVLN